MGGALILAYRSRSSQLMAAARLLAISWAFSLQFWMIAEGAVRGFAFAGVDFLIACAFFQMSRKRWFPVPLFFLHSALAVYNLYSALVGASAVWGSAFLNRAFELALLYVIGCAVYRINLLKKRLPG